MTACNASWPVLCGVVRLAGVAALLLAPAARGVCSDSAADDPKAVLDTRVEAAWKSSMVCCNGRCYRRRGPYYIEEYTNVRTVYDDPAKPKEFTVVATVRVKDVRDGWSPALPNQEIVKYRIREQSNERWEFAEVADASADETSRIECRELAFVGVAQCSCAPSGELYKNVGTRNRTERKSAR